MVETNMSSVTQVQEIEQSIEQATAMVKFGSAVERLRTNKDFKAVITEGYFEQEAVRLVHLKADPAMQSAESQASIVKQMDAIGALSEFLRTKLYLAGMAKRSIVADQETLDEILSEGNE